MPILGRFVGWQEALFAVLALTALRMLPVAVSLLGSGLRWRTVWFIGWFGPRGLASIVLGLVYLVSFTIIGHFAK